MEEPIKKRGPKADVCPPEWLVHLRAWCDQAGAAGLIRFFTVPWGRYETLLDLPAGKVGRWHKKQSAGGKRGETLLTRDDYLRLCPLLAGWHEYEPPTVEWQIL